eukprot:CAMPEP_0116136788 /NCGR_PEP_ID=MMETSP0329-20121206/11916_1 /TAXON_ID=697910 /ORGANISM="Pseudo-nitzschia arenysensis, Strain B593" /LENGTH=155 /DNA_ID=CAMNT_0003631689 /DNA_START=100 /DNA_END=568 /DNA_ORIENTATION=+
MSSKSGEKLDPISPRPSHVCEIDVTFPTDIQAEQALQILQVDKEPTDRVSKTFELVREEGTIDSEAESTDLICKLRVRFESKELKMVRVAVSSFYDYLAVVLKTLQEFDTTNSPDSLEENSSCEIEPEMSVEKGNDNDVSVLLWVEARTPLKATV